MITVVSILKTIEWLLLIPGVIGSCIVTDFFSKKLVGKMLWSWLIGQLLLWCIFQVTGVYLLLTGNTVSLCTKINSIISYGLVICSIVAWIIRFIIYKKKDRDITKVEPQNSPKGWFVAAWVAFFVILIVQTILQVKLAYVDGDDSFYVTQAVEANLSDHMYIAIPYTGMPQEFDMRHVLAPFPIWIDYISRLTGINVTSVATLILPVFLFPLTIGVYGLFGEKLLVNKKEYLPVYMLLTQIFVLFSGYSAKTPEKFLVTRIRQGKATLASLMIPVLIMLMFMFLELVRDKKKVDIRIWVTVFAVNLASCLCSVIGAMLCMLPILFVGLAVGVCYKKWKYLFPMFLCCIPNLIFAMMYLLI